MSSVITDLEKKKINMSFQGKKPDPMIDFVDRIVGFVALWGGGLMIVTLMGITVIDVTLRYFFSSPIFGARDVSKLIMLTIVALSVAYSARTGGQVSIELFADMMSPRITRWTEVFVRFIAIVMLIILAWRLWISGLNASEFGEASLALEIPFKPFYFILSIGMLLYAVVLIAEIPLFLRGRTTDLKPPSP
jgi:TRAP-type C4-dicarboxylate transport system permease small subunit